MNTKMKTITNNIKNIFPGFAAALLIAAVSKWLESLLPVHLIGASVIALFIGMLINQMKKPGKTMSFGLKFTSKKILKFAIILLGASLSIGTILEVGKMSLTVMIFTLLTCFGGGYFIGKALKLDWKLSNLISAGTGICGGSAMSATFLFDMVMILSFPLMGQALGLSDMAYGLWAGTAVNDTSSVVAAGYAYSEAAGDFATMVKLTRTLAIIPTVIIFSLINAHLKAKSQDGNNRSNTPKVKITGLLPWFIVAFLIMAVINSIGLIPASVSTTLKGISKFLMVAALAAIGLNTDFREMKKSGLNPMIHGFIISALVVIVAIAVEYFIGLV